MLQDLGELVLLVLCRYQQPNTPQVLGYSLLAWALQSEPVIHCANHL